MTTLDTLKIQIYDLRSKMKNLEKQAHEVQQQIAEKDAAIQQIEAIENAAPPKED